MSAGSAKPEILLRLSFVPGVGPNKIRALISRFGFSERIFKAHVDQLTDVIDRKTAERIKQADGRDYVADQIARMKRSDARLITLWDAEYPEQLKQIYDPPAYLFVKGTLAADDRFSIAVVGTRQPSNYGKVVTEKLASDLARKGLTIVSGLAYGIDTLAHAAAVNSGGRTLAILGSGVDVIYPYQNKALSERIVDNGALISEFPMGTEPDRNNFPRRNRLICGLSLGTVVIEAGTKSGALITAEMALEQNREVFAIPGNIDSPKSFGTNELIKLGAKVVTSSEDILEELAPQLRGFLGRSEGKIDELDLDDHEKGMLSILSHEPKHIDAIAKESGHTTSKCLSVLLSLELKSFVKQLGGKHFVKI